MAPCHLRHTDAAREALHHDVGLILPRPSPASANARDQLDPPHLRDAATGSGRLASKLTLKRNVKIIAHGSALRHNPDTTETWERSPAYGVTVTVYGLNPWNSMLTFGVDAGPVPNKADLQSFCDIITERLKRLYDV